MKAIYTAEQLRNANLNDDANATTKNTITYRGLVDTVADLIDRVEAIEKAALRGAHVSPKDKP